MTNYNVKLTEPCALSDTISTIPGDKSISHRSIIIGSLSSGTHHFTGFLCSEDCLNTVSIFQQLGVPITVDVLKKEVTLTGIGPFGLQPPKEQLYVGNSGTGIRLITGLLAAQPFTSRITGDESIEKRPMKRIIEPLQEMGASVVGQQLPDKDDIYPPLMINGKQPLHSLMQSSTAQVIEGEKRFLPNVASAQVKTALILASLYAEEDTVIQDIELTRNHTELMLSNCSKNVSIRPDHSIHITPFTSDSKVTLPQGPIPIPADFSSAAFFIVFALLRPNTELTLHHVGINPTRSTLIDILRKMGGNIEIVETFDGLEPTATLKVTSSTLQNISIDHSDSIPFFIDEIPILAVAALASKGVFELKDAEELRVKESDRIKTTVAMIRAMGGDITETKDGFIITGKGSLQVNSGCIVDSHGDHRIAMAAIIGAYAGHVDATILNTDCINTSFPNFFSILESIV